MAAIPSIDIGMGFICDKTYGSNNRTNVSLRNMSRAFYNLEPSITSLNSSPDAISEFANHDIFLPIAFTSFIDPPYSPILEETYSIQTYSDFQTRLTNIQSESDAQFPPVETTGFSGESAYLTVDIEFTSRTKTQDQFVYPILYLKTYRNTDVIDSHIGTVTWDSGTEHTQDDDILYVDWIKNITYNITVPNIQNEDFVYIYFKLTGLDVTGITDNGDISWQRGNIIDGFFWYYYDFNATVTATLTDITGTRSYTMEDLYFRQNEYKYHTPAVSI